MSNLMDRLYEEEQESPDSSTQQQMAAYVLWYDHSETQKFLGLVSAEIEKELSPRDGVDTVVSVAEQNAFKRIKRMMSNQYRHAKAIMGADD